MGDFKSAMQGIATAVKDLTSLDVVTFQGRVDLQGQSSVPDFDTVMSKVMGNTNVNAKVLASTQMKLDGDIVAFFDEDITAEQKQAHAELIKIASDSRAATVQFIKDAIGDISGF